MANKLWGGRFTKPTDRGFEAFSASYRWDRRLCSYDLLIDAAHVRALKDCGVLTDSEAKRLLSAISTLEKKQKNGSLVLGEDSEDVHSAIQTQLKNIAGNVSEKIHAGRSRNDLVSQSTRLYLKDHLGRIGRKLSSLQSAWVRKAAQYEDLLIAGMTHLQPAQIMSQAHVFLAYVEMAQRASAQVASARALCDVCVLGSGALAGATYALDQKKMARELGLSRVTTNSYDVSGDRDFVLSTLFALQMIGIHLSRIAEDLMLGQTKGFMTVDIDQSFCTGSSMMPQKKNADFVELTRGSAGLFIGNLAGFTATLKGLPTSYNRDLQWDKKFLFDSVESCEEILEIFIRMASSLQIDRERAGAFLKDESLYATDLADYLVQRGLSFKAAHDCVGKIVQFSEAQGVPMSKIGLDILKKLAPAIDGSVYDLFVPKNSVNFKKTKGSTHPRQVRSQIRFWKSKLKNFSEE